MGLFTKRKKRVSRRAEAKALKHKAAIEAKLGAKNERKRNRAEIRTQEKVAKAQIKALEAEEKAALKVAARAERELFSAAQVRKYLGVARILVPVLAPLAYRGATFVRGQIDNRRAQQLGIGLDQLSEFSGPGAKLRARIANVETTIGELESKDADVDTKKFATATRDRLDSLSAAVRTADQMPIQRRRAVHASISNELSGVESDVLARLGVR
ncbi:hypothetical protein IU501_23450 [Nocardia otitidiscaviarum]|uniref:Uncharacterized protein n=1 Tax=Nocardia otitidiscaviarum TaxID=1823 RepID=A0A378YC92_9NOCA|nr:DUF6474 family protein [Nocardia otitidiscaviarum]MBF6135952.1 hypothetical protein [Nocardia otitidiscaviarum]MBF6178812.1 hypothetical protein [Nocardia otitidiscaviarum]MBF6237996.1 hypothetical protein [Nocardia otitidiscaviarum]MBF6483707.1 hypothetical protein [Nocardia otitidiscaviarum]MCP9621904.1 DUF6474 family protein [Nocardia otitidiscaviarum]